EVCTMAQTKVNKPPNVVERNLRLTGDIMRYLLNNPQIFDSLPNNFELVILPDDDPDIRLYNLDLLDKYGSEGQPIVFARIRSKPTHISDSINPSLFAPIPLAERVGATVT
ncbi:MAG: DUF5647 family protein, partial [Chloroflexota bacterium]|nr:DUF5647 family protein [Chloroflexota bacterium]